MLCKRFVVTDIHVQYIIKSIYNLTHIYIHTRTHIQTHRHTPSHIYIDTCKTGIYAFFEVLPGYFQHVANSINDLNTTM